MYGLLPHMEKCSPRSWLSLSPKGLKASVLMTFPQQSWSAFSALSKPSSPPLFVPHCTHNSLANKWCHCLSPSHSPPPSRSEEHIHETGVQWLYIAINTVVPSKLVNKLRDLGLNAVLSMNVRTGRRITKPSTLTLSSGTPQLSSKLLAHARLCGHHNSNTIIKCADNMSLGWSKTSTCREGQTGETLGNMLGHIYGYGILHIARNPWRTSTSSGAGRRPTESWETPITLATNCCPPQGSGTTSSNRSVNSCALQTSIIVNLDLAKFTFMHIFYCTDSTC